MWRSMEPSTNLQRLASREEWICNAKTELELEAAAAMAGQQVKG